MAATAIATFCLPITVVAAMLPSVLAVPYVEPQARRRISVASIVVSVLTVAAATLQDFTGLTAKLDPWLPAAALLAFVPFMSGLVVMVSAHSSARLGRALVEAVESRARTRRCSPTGA